MVKTFTTLTFLHYVYIKHAEITLKTKKNQSFLTGYVVEHTGFEPVTSTMRTGVLVLWRAILRRVKKIPSIYVHVRNASCQDCLT